jgi:tRNA nucleotidyltransferase (CCA-adding enzyme)
MSSEIRGTQPMMDDKSERLVERSFEAASGVENKKASVQFPPPEHFLETLAENGFDSQLITYRRVLEIAEAIKAGGGQALLVGGSVRDVFFGKVSKDFDLEVYGLDAEQIEQLVQKFGKVSEVGKAFGILKITFSEGVDIDVSLPRTDSKIGEGHRGFAVKTDPNMSFEDAARRRDFTMNALAADPLSGELYDFFGGLEDIKHRYLRVTDQERFKDDPLRVLRALQFIGRFGLAIDPESQAVLQEMIPSLREIPKERIGEEWKKLLLKSERPSLGLIAGMTLGVFHELHPEFPLLAETKQEPEWHPEGDVWLHTLMTVDEAAKISRRENLENEQALTLLLAGLCHDIGKPAVTEFEDGRIRSRGHEPAGEEPTKKFLADIGMDNEIREKVVKLVKNHLVPTLLYVEEREHGRSITDGAIRRLAQRIHPATIRELVLVAEADHLGRGPFDDPEVVAQMLMPPDQYPAGQWLLERARQLKVEESKPADLTQGRDWLRIGFKPGRHIGELVRLANELRDEKNWTREDVLWLVHTVNSPEEAATKLKAHLENEKE